MKREILFKGKRIDTGEWAEGLFLTSFNAAKSIGLTACIQVIEDISYKTFEILPETLCQFINKYDKKGKKIFEGDFDNDGNCVVWCDNCNGFEFAQLDVPTKEICITCHRCDGNFFFGDHIFDFEIIGNISD